MPIGGKDWLALTPEPTLEPELPICDPHHHLWEFRPEPVHYQRYLLPDLAEDLNSGHNVRATVFIEVKARYRTDGPEEMRPVGEVEFVEGLATESARGQYGRAQVAAAIIGYADLKLGERVAPVLEAMQAASPTRFRGVRHSVGWDPSPELVNRDIQGRAGQRPVPGGRPGVGAQGAMPGEFAVPSPVGRVGRVCQGGARSHHHLEPYRWPGAGRPVRQPGRRRAARMAAGHCGRGGLSQCHHQARRCRTAPVWLRLAGHAPSPSARQSWPRRCPP